jgi:FG-GAP-like repeat
VGSAGGAAPAGRPRPGVSQATATHDLTGDGRADIVGFGDAGVWVALNNGNGTFQAPSKVLNAFAYSAGSWRVEKHPRFLADLTGDGRADIVGFGDAGVGLPSTTATAPSKLRARSLTPLPTARGVGGSRNTPASWQAKARLADDLKLVLGRAARLSGAGDHGQPVTGRVEGVTGLLDPLDHPIGQPFTGRGCGCTSCWPTARRNLSHGAGRSRQASQPWPSRRPLGLPRRGPRPVLQSAATRRSVAPRLAQTASNAMYSASRTPSAAATILVG